MTILHDHSQSISICHKIPNNTTVQITNPNESTCWLHCHTDSCLLCCGHGFCHFWAVTRMWQSTHWLFQCCGNQFSMWIWFSSVGIDRQWIFSFFFTNAIEKCNCCNIKFSWICGSAGKLLSIFCKNALDAIVLLMDKDFQKRFTYCACQNSKKIQQCVCANAFEARN